MQVPNGTGPGVRRSKRTLLASCNRCNALWKPPKFIIRSISVIKSSSVISLQIGVMSDPWRLSNDSIVKADYVSPYINMH